MVTNADNSQIGDMIELLEKLDVSAQDCVLAERYLRGDAGDEVLDQFETQDFLITWEVEREAERLMKGLCKRDQRETCIQLVNVLFAIGHDTCAQLVQGGSGVVFDAVEIELYKRIVLFVHYVTSASGIWDQGMWNRLPGIAHNRVEDLREVIEPLKVEGEKYVLPVLVLYFNRKYQEADKICGEDASYMDTYENILLHYLNTWVVRQEYREHAEVLDAIRGGQFTEKLLGQVKTRNMTNEELKRFQTVCSTAYLNHRLSPVLTNIVKACMTINVLAALYSLESVCSDGPGIVKTDNADYDELFGIEPEIYICWAAMAEKRQILKRQLEKHPDLYRKALDEKGLELLAKHYQRAGGHLDFYDTVMVANVLKDVLKQEKPELYQQEVGKMKSNHEQMIQQLVANTPHAQLAKEYLRGNCAVSELYPYDNEFGDGFQNGYVMQDYLWKYQKHCNDDGFINRCNVFLVIRRCPYMRIRKGIVNAEGVIAFFALLDGEGLDVAHQLSGFGTLYKANAYYSGCKTEILTEGAEEAFAGYLRTRREETIAAFSGAGAEGRYLALRVLRKEPDQNRREILSFVADSSKLVKEELLDILYAQTDWAEDMKALLQAKKAAQREMAVRVMAHWQQKGGNYNEALLQAMEKEKNAKVMTLLQGALNIEESAASSEMLSREDLIRQLHRGNRKKSLEWAYATTFSTVHRKDGEEADEEYLQAVLLCYVSQDKCGINKNAALLAEELNTMEFARYVNELYDKWIAAGAEAKKRWVLYAASIHGGEDIIQKLQRQIQEWPQMMRGAIAAEAVKALALNPSPRALLLVDGISRKFKFKQVKTAAGEALDFAAAELGITREELSDRIVPDLGFDENLQRTFDYGERIFKVMLTPDLAIEVYDESGKKLKNLPAPGKKDDESKAVAAYAEFKEMKKQMKAAVTSQKARLEYALSAKREWSVDAWKNLFVKNPLMHQFAIGLVWGVYEDNQLTQSFRYMEDGSFNTQDGEEYALPAQARISLVHPIELSDEEKAAWREQLADYEITQPIEQIDRAVYYMTEEEANRKSMERFGGCIINDLSLNGKLTGQGWYRGSVQDGGVYYTYYREDVDFGMGVELHFSGNGVGGYYEEVTVYDARFYKAGDVEHGSYVYDEADKKKAYFLKDVPPRYFSEIVLQLARATASSQERDENWKKDAELI